MTVELVYNRFSRVLRVPVDFSIQCVDCLHSFGVGYAEIDAMLDAYERKKRR